MADSQRVLRTIEDLYPGLPPKLKRAARYVVGSPTDVALYPLRRVAENAQVGATTMIRLAQLLGFDTYDLFRAAFRDNLRSGSTRYFNRARDLQTRRGDPDLAQVLRSLASNIEDSLHELFERTDAAEIARAADRIRRARRVFVIGLRSWFAAAFYFHYVAQTFTDKIVLLENRGGMLIDELGDIGSDDLVLGMSFDPYAADTVKVVQLASERGCGLITLTDSPVSPLAIPQAQIFLLPTTSTSFYQSLVPTMAFLEALLAFAVMRWGKEAVDRIRDGFSRREAFGVYWQESR